MKLRAKAMDEKGKETCGGDERTRAAVRKQQRSTERGHHFTPPLLHWAPELFKRRRKGEGNVQRECNCL